MGLIAMVQTAWSSRNRKTGFSIVDKAVSRIVSNKPIQSNEVEGQCERAKK